MVTEIIYITHVQTLQWIIYPHVVITIYVRTDIVIKRGHIFSIPFRFKFIHLMPLPKCKNLGSYENLGRLSPCDLCTDPFNFVRSCDYKLMFSSIISLSETGAKKDHQLRQKISCPSWKREFLDCIPPSWITTSPAFPPLGCQCPLYYTMLIILRM